MHPFSRMSNQNRGVLSAGIFIFLAVLLVNVRQLVGREFISTINTLTMFLFQSASAWQALSYWRSIQNRAEAKRVWLILGLGLGLYALGNLVWLFYNLNGISAPYPSLGDFFFFVAYPLIALALINKNILLGILPDRRQIALIIAGGAAAFMTIGYFVFLPIWVAMESPRAVEVMLNFFYPLMDFVILVAASFLVLVLWKGRLALTWNVIAAGFLFLSISDLLFTYSTWNGLYYAGGTVNLLTRVVDVGYSLASLLIAIGIYIQQLVGSVEPEALEFEFAKSATAIQTPLPILPFSAEVARLFEKMFFMVDHEQQVFFFSNSYRDLYQLAGGTQNLQWGAPFHLVCGADVAVSKRMFAEMQQKGMAVLPADIVVGKYSVPVVFQAKIARKGADVFLRYRQENAPVVIEEKPAIEITLIEETLCSVAGIESAAPELREATAFFVIEVQELYIFLVQMGGFRVGQVLAQKFNQAAKDTYASVRVNDGQVVLTGVLGYGAMSSLLQLTMKTVQDLTSAAAVQEVIKQLNTRVPENIIHAAQNAGLAL